MKALTWFELSTLEAGTRVQFVEPFDIFSENILVPAGTLATLMDNSLNEIQPLMAVLPDDRDIRRKLLDWDGEVILYGWTNNGGMINSADADPTHEDSEWQQESPLALAPPVGEAANEVRKVTLEGSIRVLGYVAFLIENYFDHNPALDNGTILPAPVESDDEYALRLIGDALVAQFKRQGVNPAVEVTEDFRDATPPDMPRRQQR
jgi:hypothetical protein